ncbi:hypothetical protein Vretimale_10195 [Volvox reticuliferus]|uniref:Flavin-containing monooxygenase n=1 Tax=Volvox reticuliferus TaxID=1737510 RepID=A0A8J4BX06_9CHLO|nr:hypothetical protein Vretifemale_522 [Volvox reticuliferus]GIM05803.1 hypothetical protein Vretimale_10195 [Volvox reticuliferus]
MSAGEKEGPSTDIRKLAVVIGAGVAGCQAARALLRAGYDALILEQGRGLGGVWRRNYHSFGLQVPFCCYTFPEFPYSKAPSELAERAEREGYPTGETVKEYIAAYCAHFKMEHHVLYGAKVVHLGVLPNNRWSVRFRQAISPGQSPQLGPLKTMEADVVVMATGMYYSPYLPSVPGLASFKGTVLHARDFVSVSGLAGKHVLVLGGGKSATDCAVVAASPSSGAASVTTLFRQAHWPLPRQLFGLPFHRIVYTRFVAAMLPMYYTGQGNTVKRLKHTLQSPLKRLFWRTLESHVARKMRLRGQLRPELDFVQDLFFGGQIQDGSWNEAVNAGRISAVKGSLAEVRPHGVRLTDGTVIECDVLIFATGYTKDYSLFDAATAGRLMATASSPGAEAGLHLYRSILSPWVPNLYFIGCEASSFNNMLTSGLQSLWMMHHLLGRLHLPGPQELMKDIQQQRSWRKSVMPPQYYCASVIMLYQQRYHDQLVRDMGHPARRKCAARKGGSECFGVYTSEDYADLFTDAAVPGLAALTAAAPPPRSAAAVMAAAVTLMPAAAAIGARLDLAVMPSTEGAVPGASGLRPATLVPVCTEHSDAVAIAVAPAEDEAATAGASTQSNAFINSLDSPAKPTNTRPAARDGLSSTAFSPRTLTPPAVRRLQLSEATFDSTAAAAAAADVSLRDGGDGTAVFEASTTDGHRSSLGPMGLPAGSAMSNVVPSGAVSIIDGGAIGAGAQSGLSTGTGFAVASVGGSAQQGRTSSPRPVTALAHRIRLQVLQIINRSIGSGQHAGAPYNGEAEEVLEFRVASNATFSGRLPDSLGTGSRGGHTTAHGSGNFCYDNMRHGTPNAYSELTGSLEVH